MNKHANEHAMEEVKAAIHEWCAAVLAKGHSTASAEELTDHFYCEIERLMAEGMSATAAFTAATEQMGQSAMLRDEFAKNRNLVTKLLCAIQATETSALTEENKSLIGPQKMVVITLANLILLAIVTFSLERILDGTDLFPQVGSLLYILWFGSFMIFYSATMPSATDEIACLRRKVAGLFKRG
ncbi:MAG TPA: hypothetical protein P5121_39475 [Caldilineaceae bacterium]|nr:hypothetical protein [Caldilineaceae bacterium]